MRCNSDTRDNAKSCSDPTSKNTATLPCLSTGWFRRLLSRVVSLLVPLLPFYSGSLGKRGRAIAEAQSEVRAHITSLGGARACHLGGFLEHL